MSSKHSVDLAASWGCSIKVCEDTRFNQTVQMSLAERAGAQVKDGFAVWKNIIFGRWWGSVRWGLVVALIKGGNKLCFAGG